MSRSAKPDLATCVTLACLWEALAPKPGNVYRGADFEDLTFADFAASATVVGPPLGRAGEGVGDAALAAVDAMRNAVGTNAYLGAVLLLAPLAAAASRGVPVAATIGGVLDELGAADAIAVYAAIRLAEPGGMGEVAVADVAGEPPPELGLVEAMALAAERDLVARQYVNRFADVAAVANLIASGTDRGWSLCDAIVHAHVTTMAMHPDSLIARKCGSQVAEQAAARAAKALDAGAPGEIAYADALADLDFWLRSDGHRRNPGTTADLIAAGLFVLLVEARIELPARFYA
ncbi:MAG: triphosphoribosyl-dephospho-CoA synthase [Pirellulales bacterium]|nr:triphosphoribosyl-dephospho-CoA synthase [Pirellulales bacterium]